MSVSHVTCISLKGSWGGLSRASQVTPLLELVLVSLTLVANTD